MCARSMSRQCFVSGLLLALGLVTIGTQAGCEKRKQEQASSPFAGQDNEYLLSVVVDMSGSYAYEMQKDGGKAYRFLMRLVDRFFRDRLGSTDRIVISQLSATEKSLLWDGSPQTLRRSFPSAEAFRDFLLARSNPNGSRVHHAIADTVDYVTDYPGVSTKKTKSAVVVLSDMMDNAPEPEKSLKRLLESLSRYGQADGVVGIYWCDQALVPVWRKLLKDAGVRHYAVESEIVVDPPLPSFE